MYMLLVFIYCIPVFIYYYSIYCYPPWVPFLGLKSRLEIYDNKEISIHAIGLNVKMVTEGLRRGIITFKVKMGFSH